MQRRTNQPTVRPTCLHTQRLYEKSDASRSALGAGCRKHARQSHPEWLRTRSASVVLQGGRRPKADVYCVAIDDALTAAVPFGESTGYDVDDDLGTPVPTSMLVLAADRDEWSGWQFDDELDRWFDACPTL